MELVKSAKNESTRHSLQFRALQRNGNKFIAYFPLLQLYRCVQKVFCFILMLTSEAEFSCFLANGLQRILLINTCSLLRLIKTHKIYFAEGN